MNPVVFVPFDQRTSNFCDCLPFRSPGPTAFIFTNAYKTDGIMLPGMAVCIYGLFKGTHKIGILVHGGIGIERIISASSTIEYLS